MIIGPAVYSISSGTSAGYLTLSSVFGLHVKSVVSVRKDGEDSLECVVTEVIHGSSPGIRVRARSTTNYPSYGATNVSAYTGGTVQLPRQDWVPESGQGDGDFAGNLTVVGNSITYGLLFPPTYATAGLPTATSSTEGSVVYDATTQTLKFSDGATWSELGGGGGYISAIGNVDAAGSSNAKGMTVSATTLYLNSASASFPGIVTAADQAFGGVKTIDDGIVSGFAGFGLDEGGVTSPKQLSNFGTDNDAGTIVSSNLYLDGAGALKIAQNYDNTGGNGMSGAAIAIPGWGQTRQGSIEFWTTPKGAVTAGAAYAQASPRAVIDNDGNFYVDTNVLYVDATNNTVGVNQTPDAIAGLGITGTTLVAQASGAVAGLNVAATLTSNSNIGAATYAIAKIKPTINFGASNASKTVNVLEIDTTNTAVTGGTINLIKASYGGTAKFTVNNDGKITLANAQVDVGTGNFYSVGTDAFVGGIIRPAATGTAMKIRGADNASADIAYFGSAIALTTGKIARFYNDLFVTEKANIAADGSYVTTTGSITATTITANSSLIQSGGNQAMEVKGWAADSGSAIGVKLISANELTTVGAMIANFYNASTIKGSVTKDGQFRTIGSGRYLEISASQAITVANEYIVVKGNGAAVTVTLPLASTVAAGYGFTIKDGAGTAVTYNITIARAGADTIDGATSQIMTVNWGSVDLVSDGVSAWYLV